MLRLSYDLHMDVDRSMVAAPVVLMTAVLLDIHLAT